MKFKNRDVKTGNEFLYEISMSSVQGGVEVEVNEVQVEPEMKNMRQRTLLMTPMDAAAFVHDARVTNGLACRQVGHGTSADGAGLTLYVQNLSVRGGEFSNIDFIGDFIGDVEEVRLSIAGVSMVVPTFVIDAMRIAVEHMFTSLMYSTTGDMEEEFG